MAEITAARPQPPHVSELLEMDREALVPAVREGLPFAVLERIQSLLDVPVKTFAPVLHTTPRSLRRRRKEGHLSPEESNHLIRLARLVQLALWVFDDDPERAARWLTGSKRLLGGETPLEYADTEPGAEEISRLLYALEFSLPA